MLHNLESAVMAAGFIRARTLFSCRTVPPGAASSGLSNCGPALVGIPLTVAVTGEPTTCRKGFMPEWQADKVLKGCQGPRYRYGLHRTSGLCCRGFTQQYSFSTREFPVRHTRSAEEHRSAKGLASVGGRLESTLSRHSSHSSLLCPHSFCPHSPPCSCC